MLVGAQKAPLRTFKFLFGGPVLPADDLRGLAEILREDVKEKEKMGIEILRSEGQHGRTAN